jgi:hypothetical protein
MACVAHFHVQPPDNRKRLDATSQTGWARFRAQSAGIELGSINSNTPYYGPYTQKPQAQDLMRKVTHLSVHTYSIYFYMYYMMYVYVYPGYAYA